MKTVTVLIAVLVLFASAAMAQAPGGPAQMPVDRLRTNIEQIAKSVDTNWGIDIKCIETNEEVLIGPSIEDAIGRMTEQVANYFANRSQ